MSETEKFRWGIQSKLFSAFLAIALVPLVAFWLVDRSRAQTTAQTNVEASLQRTSQLVVGSIDDWMQINLTALQLTARDPALHTTDVVGQIAQLKTIKATLPWVSHVHTIAADGNNIARSDDQPYRKFDDRNYFKQAMQGSFGSEVIVSRTTKKPALSLAVPIQNDLGKPSGVLAEVSSLDSISAAVLKSSVGRTGYAFLTDGDGKLIAHPHEKMGENLLDYGGNPAIRAGKSGQFGFLRYVDNGQEVLANVQRTNAGWLSVVQQDIAEINEPVRQEDIYMIVLLISTALVVVVLSLFSSRNLVRPIVFLTEIADQISRGQLDHQIEESKRSDEIGALARSIERLAKSMKIALERMRKR